MLPETDADPEWVAGLAGCAGESAQDALAWAQDQRSLYRHLAREHDREGRTSYIEIDAPLELLALVRLTRPRHVIEVGVSSGVSSAYVLRGLEANGRGTLHSVDLPRPARQGSDSHAPSWSVPANRTSGWAVPQRLRPRWDLRIGDKRDVLPLLAEDLDEVDLFIYDVPHDDADAWEEFQLLDPHLARPAVAIADHGPTGDLCGALRNWARRRRAAPLRRARLGLYGFRSGPRPSR